MKSKTIKSRIMIVTGILLVCGILIALGSGCTGWGSWDKYCGWGGCGWKGCGGCGDCGSECGCGPKFYINGEDNSGGVVIIGNGPPVNTPEPPSFDSLPKPSTSAYKPASVPGNAPTQAPPVELPSVVPPQYQYGKPSPPSSVP